MNIQTLRSYLLYFVPTFAIPVALYFFDSGIPVLDLVKAGFLLPLLMLSVKGLTVFFPEENLPGRSLVRMVEYAILQGMVIAAVLVLFTGFTQPELQPGVFAASRQFLIATIAMALSAFLTEKTKQSKLRSS